jgi:hypothetical protein
MHDQKKYRETISALVLKCFTGYGKQNEIDRMKVLISQINDRSIPVLELSESIKIHEERSVYPPVLADILAPIRNRLDSQNNREIQNKWDYFVKNAFNPYESHKLESWAKEVKSKIGNWRIDNAVKTDMVWIKKEFEDLLKIDNCLHLDKIASSDRHKIGSEK